MLTEVYSISRNMDCDQFSSDNGALLTMHDLHMLRDYDQRGLTRHEQSGIVMGSVDDRANNMRMQCGAPIQLARGEVIPGYPFVMKGDAADDIYHTWPKTTPLNKYNRHGVVGIADANKKRKAIEASWKGKPMPTPAVHYGADDKYCINNLLKDDASVVFLFIIMVLVAMCVYLSKSVSELRTQMQSLLVGRPNSTQ